MTTITQLRAIPFSCACGGHFCLNSFAKHRKTMIHRESEIGQYTVLYTNTEAIPYSLETQEELDRYVSIKNEIKTIRTDAQRIRRDETVRRAGWGLRMRDFFGCHVHRVYEDISEWRQMGGGSIDILYEFRNAINTKYESDCDLYE